MSEYLALLLKHARGSVGLTQERIAEAVHVSSSLIAMFETGRRIPHPDTARQLDEVLGTGSLIVNMSGEARRNRQPEWFRPLAEYERDVTALRTLEAQVVPGLLQTPAYARAVLTSGLMTRDQIEEALAVRLERQSVVLERNQPPVCTFVIDEDALHRGEPAILREQLLHLIELSERLRVYVHVTPRDAGMHPGQNGPFTLLSLEAGETVGYVDDHLAGHIVIDPKRVAALEQSWQAVCAAALSCGQSRELISKLVKEL